MTIPCVASEEIQFGYQEKNIERKGSQALEQGSGRVTIPGGVWKMCGCCAEECGLVAVA